MIETTRIQFIPSPFQPQPGLTGPHAQTVAAFLLRHNRGITFRRTRLDTPDGDFVDIDFPIVRGYGWLWSELGAQTPMVLVLHGIEGSARGSLALEIYRQLAQQGIRAVGMNFRSCSGEMNRTHTLYHSGFTDDTAMTLAWLDDQYPDVPKGLMGFSLGANVTLKYMGTGAALVETAVAISPPFDLSLGADRMAEVGRFYMQSIMRSIKRKAQLNRPLYEPYIDVDGVLASSTFREMDDLWQPINGFRDAQDYYDSVSSKNFLSTITKPTLIMRSLDDPFFDPRDIPDVLFENQALIPVLTEHGGHGGFLEKASFIHPRFWAEREAARFLSKVLGSEK